MTQYTKPPVLPAWGESAGGADVLQPTNAEIQAGWPLSNVPPSRKRFNWILKYLAQGVRYLMQMGIPLWDATEDYPVNARVMGSNGKTYKALQTCINQDPTTATAYWQVWGTEGRDDQLQLTTAFTTAGAAPNFTLTPLPAPAALTANLRFRVKFHAAGAGSDVINIAGLGNKSLKQYDSTGAKVASVIALGQLVDVEYDGVDLVMLDPLPSGVTSSNVQSQTYSAFTATGSAPSFVLTPNPPIAAYSLNQRFNITFTASGTTGSNTINLSALGAKNIKQYDAAGAKVPGVIVSGRNYDLQYDGTDFVILNRADVNSLVRLNTANGHGSTNTCIRRYSTVVTNQGSDIGYTDSAAAGASFTINTSGVYAISMSEQASSTACWAAIALNQSPLTANATTLASNSTLAISTNQAGAGYGTQVSWSGYLPAGSVIYPFTYGVAAGGLANGNTFTIARVG